ncbi:MAG: hypothetical protein ACOYL6_01475 [Bacteriovoracaceae bacterium]
MKKSLLLFSLFLNLASIGAFARSPAVDNFIGVEPANYKDRAPSSEKPYNFEKGSGLTQRQITSLTSAPSKKEAMVGFWGYTLFTLILGTPFLLWGMMMKKLGSETATENVVPLNNKNEDDIKKAS